MSQTPLVGVCEPSVVLEIRRRDLNYLCVPGNEHEMLQPNLFLFRKKIYGFGNIFTCAEHTCSFFISSLSKIAPASVFLPPPSYFPD